MKWPSCCICRSPMKTKSSASRPPRRRTCWWPPTRQPRPRPPAPLPRAAPILAADDGRRRRRGAAGDRRRRRLSGGKDDARAVAQNTEASPAQKTLTEQPSAPQTAPSAPVEPERRRAAAAGGAGVLQTAAGRTGQPRRQAAAGNAGRKRLRQPESGAGPLSAGDPPQRSAPPAATQHRHRRHGWSIRPPPVNSVLNPRRSGVSLFHETDAPLPTLIGRAARPLQRWGKQNTTSITEDVLMLDRIIAHTPLGGATVVPLTGRYRSAFHPFRLLY